MPEATDIEVQVWKHLFVDAFMKLASKNGRDVEMETAYSVANAWEQADGINLDPAQCADGAFFRPG